MSSPQPTTSVRADWLETVVREAQCFAGRYLESPSDPPDVQVFVASVSAPDGPVERLILRGLSSQLETQRRISVDRYQTRLGQVPDAGRVRQVIRLLNGSLHKRWSVPELARRVGSNRTDLERAFTHVTGCSIHRFLVRRRIESAKKLLVASEIPVKKVAEKVGYQGLGSFYRQFDRIAGVTPRDYRCRSRRRGS